MFTVGHSNRSIEEFIAILKGHGVKILADVRRLPGSDRYPQFNQDELKASLKEHGIRYVYFPHLGGRRRPVKNRNKNAAWRVAAFRGYADYMESPEFQKSLERLLALAKKKSVAVMCAEVLPWRCHRRLIADAAVSRGIPTFDIMTASKAVPHELPEWARVRAGNLSYPGPKAA